MSVAQTPAFESTSRMVRFCIMPLQFSMTNVSVPAFALKSSIAFGATVRSSALSLTIRLREDFHLPSGRNRRLLELIHSDNGAPSSRPELLTATIYPGGKNDCFANVIAARVTLRHRRCALRCNNRFLSCSNRGTFVLANSRIGSKLIWGDGFNVGISCAIGMHCIDACCRGASACRMR